MTKDLGVFEDDIRSKIYTLRGVQVILDEDLARLYEVGTKNMNLLVKRNIKRFPKDFRFQLTKEEFLRFHFETSNRGGRRYLPYAFTEQGISMLSGILRSDKAIEVNIKIMRAFVSMRKIINSNLEIFSRLESFEKFKIESNEKFDKIFDYMSLNKPKQGIFFDGQVFDAYRFVNDLISKAKKEIILYDNYVDYTTLSLFSKTKVHVKHEDR